MSKALTKVIGILALSACLGSTASAGGWSARASMGKANIFASDAPTTATSAPEIDPASALSAMTLLLGGLAVVRGRRSK